MTMKTTIFELIFTTDWAEDYGVKDGQLWINCGARWIRFRCPCGCGDLMLLPLHPDATEKMWGRQIYYDGRAVTITGSIFNESGCKSNYYIRESKTVWG